MVEDIWRIQSDGRRENSQKPMTIVLGSSINTNINIISVHLSANITTVMVSKKTLLFVLSDIKWLGSEPNLKILVLLSC
jgi:hypothetical protein